VTTVIDEYYSATSLGHRRAWQDYSMELGDELR